MTDFSSPPPGGNAPRPGFLPPSVRNPQLPTPAQLDPHEQPYQSAGAMPQPQVADMPLGRIEPAVADDDGHWTEALQDAPPWLGSLVIHMMVLIFMGLMVVSLQKKSEVPIQAIYGDTDKPGEQLLEDNAKGSRPTSPTRRLIKQFFRLPICPPSPIPLAAPPLATEFSPNGLFAGSTKAIDAPIGLALSGRERGMRKALLAATAATPQPKVRCTAP